MRRWLTFRVGIALVVGLVAGAIVWSLPPRPTMTIRLPEDVPNPLVPRTRLVGLSSNGRFLVLQRWRGMDNTGAAHGTFVWDRDKSADGSWTEIPEGLRELGSAFFSDDESTLTLIHWTNARLSDRALVYDLASTKLVREFAPTIDGRDIRWLEVTGVIGEYLVYRDGKDVRIDSWLRGKRVTSAKLPSDLMGVVFVSKDAKIIIAQGWRDRAIVAGMGLHQAFIDTSTGIVHEEGEHLFGSNQIHSPDGTLQIWFGPTEWSPWLKRVWPMKLPEECVRIRRWSTDERLATFYHVKDGCISPQGNLLALLRDDGDVIDIYEFPFRAPWWQIALAGIAASAFTWCIGWLWARRRGKPQGGAA